MSSLHDKTMTGWSKIVKFESHFAYVCLINENGGGINLLPHVNVEQKDPCITHCEIQTYATLQS
jgi:hypothetical protein